MIITKGVQGSAWPGGKGDRLGIAQKFKVLPYYQMVYVQTILENEMSLDGLDSSSDFHFPQFLFLIHFFHFKDTKYPLEYLEESWKSDCLVPLKWFSKAWKRNWGNRKAEEEWKPSRLQHCCDQAYLGESWRSNWLVPLKWFTNVWKRVWGNKKSEEESKPSRPPALLP